MPESTRDPAEQARRRARLEWLLPPLLAVVAIALQLAIDVPHHEMIVRGDDDEAAEPAEKTTTAARTPRPWRARGAAYVERLRKSWSQRPITDEPVDPRFADHHEQLLRAIVRKAEVAVMPLDEPELVLTHATCHTIRCELEFCAPPELAAGIVEHLPNFTVGGRSLWHELRELESQEPSNSKQSCHRYLIDFAVEGADPRNLRLLL
ncbi:MAG TPA: hypothetical protein VK034_30070 [Enhygromyxa sp.]|nr:hypothetical protein [Enhygromyxa sp.]